VTASPLDRISARVEVVTDELGSAAEGLARARVNGPKPVPRIHFGRSLMNADAMAARCASTSRRMPTTATG
jgi:hypothetical protein